MERATEWRDTPSTLWNLGDLQVLQNVFNNMVVIACLIYTLLKPVNQSAIFGGLHRPFRYTLSIFSKSRHPAESRSAGDKHFWWVRPYTPPKLPS